MSDNVKKEAFVCERCNSITYVDVTKLHQYLDENKENFELCGNFGTMFGIKCSTCNGIDTYHVDKEIADIIVRLNERGYITKFSCAGHIDTDGFHTSGIPYIMIEWNDKFINWVKNSPTYTKFRNELVISIWKDMIKIEPSYFMSNNLITEEYLSNVRNKFSELSKSLPL